VGLGLGGLCKGCLFLGISHELDTGLHYLIEFSQVPSEEDAIIDSILRRRKLRLEVGESLPRVTEQVGSSQDPHQI
jgi:hypothetical protein